MRVTRVLGAVVAAGTLSLLGVAGAGPTRAVVASGSSPAWHRTATAYVLALNGKGLFDSYGTVTPIRVAANTAIKGVKVGFRPFTIVMTRNGKTVYVVDYRPG
ncbi:MAG TPA: hypothetical protein VNF47_08950 [Streptosporangiaceae bacterium]|nr:hypothetical protein [Streptosporangiaceae bacterium]